LVRKGGHEEKGGKRTALVVGGERGFHVHGRKSEKSKSYSGGVFMRGDLKRDAVRGKGRILRSAKKLGKGDGAKTHQKEVVRGGEGKFSGGGVASKEVLSKYGEYYFD